MNQTTAVHTDAGSLIIQATRTFHPWLAHGLLACISAHLSASLLMPAWAFGLPPVPTSR